MDGDSPVVDAGIERSKSHSLFGQAIHGPDFKIFLHQECVAAIRALLRNRLVGRSEFALRIIASIRRRCCPCGRASRPDLAVFAQRALHADEVLLHVFAVGIAAAGGELAVASVADHQVASALRALFIQRNIGNASCPDRDGAWSCNPDIRCRP